MQKSRSVLCGGLAAALLALAVAPAGATTLIRQGLDHLVAGNTTIVLGEVLDATSYWNAEKTFILTDVRIAPQEVFKGEVPERELTITILGGKVGDLTALIVGGAELILGRKYLLFLDEEDMPGARRALTVRDHSQGVFDILMAQDGPRAVSQASRQDLFPDASGENRAPGGLQGIRLDSLQLTIRELVKQGTRREVKQ